MVSSLNEQNLQELSTEQLESYMNELLQDTIQIQNSNSTATRSLASARKEGEKYQKQQASFLNKLENWPSNLRMPTNNIKKNITELNPSFVNIDKTMLWRLQEMDEAIWLNRTANSKKNDWEIIKREHISIKTKLVKEEIQFLKQATIAEGNREEAVKQASSLQSQINRHANEDSRSCWVPSPHQDQGCMNQRKVHRENLEKEKNKKHSEASEHATAKKTAEDKAMAAKTRIQETTQKEKTAADKINAYETDSKTHSAAFETAQAEAEKILKKKATAAQTKAEKAATKEKSYEELIKEFNALFEKKTNNKQDVEKEIALRELDEMEFIDHYPDPEGKTDHKPQESTIEIELEAETYFDTQQHN